MFRDLENILIGLWSHFDKLVMRFEQGVDTSSIRCSVQNPITFLLDPEQFWTKFGRHSDKFLMILRYNFDKMLKRLRRRFRSDFDRTLVGI